MDTLIRNIGVDSMEVLDADHTYRTVNIRWNEHGELSDRTREELLATGFLLHLGLPVIGTINCIDGILDEIGMAAFSARTEAEERERTQKRTPKHDR